MSCEYEELGMAQAEEIEAARSRGGIKRTGISTNDGFDWLAPRLAEEA